MGACMHKHDTRHLQGLYSSVFRCHESMHGSEAPVVTPNRHQPTKRTPRDDSRHGAMEAGSIRAATTRPRRNATSRQQLSCTTGSPPPLAPVAPIMHMRLRARSSQVNARGRPAGLPCCSQRRTVQWIPPEGARRPPRHHHDVRSRSGEIQPLSACPPARR